MECKCGNKEVVSWRSGFFTNESGERESYEFCDKCGNAGNLSFPDVYFDGKPEENLADGPDGKPITFLSRGHKARYLKEHGISEAGDRFHGAPFTTLGKEDVEGRKRAWNNSVAESRRKVESMGRDVRRQAILKIIKETRQYAKAS